MKKKLITLILAIVCALCCALSLAACNTTTARKVDGLLVAKTGEKPDHGDFALYTTITYGEKPKLDYKLYLSYSDGEIDTNEIAFDDEKLSVEYSFYNRSSKKTEKIVKLPKEYLAGTYTVAYSYDGASKNSESKATVFINVNAAESGAFCVEPVKSTWYKDEKTPDVILKNPKGLAVKDEESTSTQLQTDDSNGDYSLYYIKKEVYETFTEAQKTDWKFMSDFFSADVNKPEHDIWNYYPDECSAIGNYMLFGMVAETYNYSHIVTPAVEITVKDPIIERVFTFKNIVLQDKEGNTVTDRDNEYVAMAESMDEANQGKTVICKASGEVRGTVDFGNDAFDELSAEDVFRYSVNGTNLSIYTYSHDLVGEGIKSGNTLTLKMPIGEDYDWVITFTCE